MVAEIERFGKAGVGIVFGGGNASRSTRPASRDPGNNNI
jgi:hypothetical protein